MDQQQAAPTKTGGGDSELREDVPNENPESYCRLCFSETNVHALFPQNGSIIREITEKIRNCAGVQISVREDYPAGICHSCLSILDEINQFQQRSRRCDEIIRTKRSLLEQITVKVEMTEEEGVSFVPPATAGGDDYGNDDCLTESSIIAEAITTLNGMGDLMGTFHHHHHHHHSTNQPLVQVKADMDGVSGASQKDHRCMVCSKVFPDRETWMMHLGDHAEERPHQCMECLAQFREKRSLARHMKAVHEEVRDRQCPYCPKSFKYSHHLRYHIRTHTGEKPYVCQICSDCFSQHIQWKRHMVKHQHRKQQQQQQSQPHVQTPRVEDPQIKCEFCPRVFSRQQDYRRHQPSHNADNLNLSSIQQAQHQMQQHLQQLHHNHVPVQQQPHSSLPPHLQQQQQQQHQSAQLPQQPLLQPPVALHRRD